MKRIKGGKKQRPVIRHENANLGAGAGITHGTIVVPGHNMFPAPSGGTPHEAESVRSPHAETPPMRTGSISSASNATYRTQSQTLAHVHPQAMAAAGMYETPQMGISPEPSRTSSPAPSTAPLSPTGAPSRSRVLPPRVSQTQPFQQLPGEVPLDAYSNPVMAPAPAPPTLQAPKANADVLVQPVQQVEPVSLYAALPPPVQARAPGRQSRADSLVPTPPVSHMESEPASPAMPSSPMPETVDGAHSRRAPRAPKPAPGPVPVPPLAVNKAEDQAPRLGSLTQERVLADARRKQKLRLLRSAEREREREREQRHYPMQPQRLMQPQPSRPVDSYMDMRDAPNFRALQAVLRKIKSEWDFLLDTDFNPVRLSMALLPHGPLHGYMSDFSALSTMIESSLQSTVGDHYNSFASAITINHGMVTLLSASQDGISGARKQLQTARDALGTRRADLVQMWQRMQSVKEAMRVLGLIEQLRDVPDELESLMAEKRFLEATQLLMRSLRLIQRDDLAEVGATADLRAYLRSQEHSLLDILIDELQSHLYLKSYWCDARWQSYMPGQDTLPDVVLGAPGSAERAWTTLTQFLSALHTRRFPGDERAEWRYGQDLKPATSTLKVSEEDSFMYLEMLLESLVQLGKIGYALDTIAQLVPTELHQLVDTTIEQVEARYASQATPTSVRLETVLMTPRAMHTVLEEGRTHRSFSLRAAPSNAPSRIAASAEFAALQRDTDMLRDFFWTLYSKLEAVLAAHRAIQEVAYVLISRANPEDAGAADRASAETGVAALARVWAAVEQEIWLLLLDYLAEDSERSTVSQHVPSLDAVLRMTRFERERNTLFRLTPAPGASGVHASTARVDEALDAYVPGLMGKEVALPFALEPRTTADEYLGAGHRRLVKPLSFTASILLPPTLQFALRAEQLFPADAAPGADFGAFLREFVQERFLPLLGEQVHALMLGAANAPDAFHAEPATRTGTQRAVVRSSLQLVALVDSLYSMLQAAPFEQAGFTHVIVLAFLVYYEACNGCFKKLVSGEAEDGADASYTRAAQWIQRQELHACLAAALDAKPGSVRAGDIKEAEARTEMRMAEGVPLERTDLITSRKRHMALGTLHHSVHWLFTHMAQFQMQSVAEAREACDAEPSSHVAAAPMAAEGAGVGASGSAAVPLPLPLPVAPDMQALWPDVPAMYSRLARCILMTLRVELRLKALYYLREAIRGSYMCDALSMEPDVHVVELNTELSACHEVYKDTMLPEHHAFVFDGLDVLMDAVMTEAILHVRAVNRFGVTKMLRNLLSVQQNLKNIVHEPRSVDLERSKRLWELLAREPEQWLPDALGAYSAAEYLAVVRLSFGWGADNQPIPHAGTTHKRASDERFRSCVDALDIALKRGVPT